MAINEPKFFFDTANSDFVSQTWNKLGDINYNYLAGITTNPSALAKENCKTLSEFEVIVYKLCRTLTQIRNGYGGGLVYVQIPNSNALDIEYISWYNYISQLGDGKTKVVLKIPPYPRILNLIDEMEKNSFISKLNVTGIADAATALRCISFPVKYISIIPGRMQEVGIDANAHLDCLEQRNKSTNEGVIAGSMRTLEGLQDAIIRGCIPTIGPRVWNLMTPDHFATFVDLWNYKPLNKNYYGLIPHCDEKNINLTQSFFTQMDELGSSLFNEFVTSSYNK